MNAFSEIIKGKIIAIVRGLRTRDVVNLAEALYAGGIGAVEVTFNQAAPETWPDTAQAIRALTKLPVKPGAGTVMSPEQYALARDAGAQYIIMPHTDPAMIRQIKADRLYAVPGAFTPTEIAMAHKAGADAVKVFPAGLVGASYIKAIRAPLSDVPLMAVGGINETNAKSFLDAGCVGVGVGGSLVNKAWAANGEWDKIKALAIRYRKAVE